MSHGIPEFPILKSNYPNLKDSVVVRRNIGGEVAKTIGQTAFENTCTVRISRDLNYSNVLVPAHLRGLHTLQGGDRFRYAYRVRDMRHWLTTKFGPPDIEVKGPPVSRQPFSSHKGIIAFDIHFRTATGHFDLWDGRTFHNEIYEDRPSNFFEIARMVQLWVARGEGFLERPPDMPS